MTRTHSTRPDVAALLSTLIPALFAFYASGPASAVGTFPITVSLGTLHDPALTESSGIAASRRKPGLFWTHNDSGDGPFVYAMGSHGEQRGTFQLRGVPAVVDCEDIAIGPGPKRGMPLLYLGDIGDNTHSRAECAVYRFPEPIVERTASRSSRMHPVMTAPVETLRYRYPDGPHDAESLLVHPVTGRIYIVVKNRNGLDGVYTFPVPLRPTETVTLVKIASIRIRDEPPFHPNLVTGGDISPDGNHLVLRTYWNAYEYSLPPRAKSFDSIWETVPALIPLPLQPQGEGIAYTYPDGKALILTSEGRGTTLYLLQKK